MVGNDDIKQTNGLKILTKSNLLFTLLLIFPIAYAYMYHIESLFENDKYFSHLSTLERELSFRTESGLYYYYFKILVSKQIVVAKTKTESKTDSNIYYKYEYNKKNIHKSIRDHIINDNMTEYPNTINALERFNLYPEIISAFVYHLFYRNNLLPNSKCYSINRGDNAASIESCIGYREPIYFYSKIVFILHGISFALFFLLCWILNDYSIPAGLLGCLCYIYNHGEATRVMWSPALRESFAYPFHVLQLLLVTRELKEKQTRYSRCTLLVVTTLFYLLTWQFAQFSLGTQAASIYFTYILGYISLKKLIKLLLIHTISLVLCFVFMFYNRMLLASFFSSILISIWLLIGLNYLLRRVTNKLNLMFSLIYFIAQVVSFFVLIVCTKKFLLPLIFFIDNDDTHIWDILKSKMSKFLQNEFHTFDTRLYLCAREFDFLEFETIIKLSKTLILPVVLINLVFCGFKLLKEKMKKIEEIEDSDGHLVYNILQLSAFTVMAGLIMRLKLFWTPHLCVIFTIILNDKFSVLNVIKKFKIPFKFTVIAIIVALMSVEGIENLKKQYQILGEYNDYPMENLINWINLNTPQQSSFSGSMPTMANVKLSTNRAIMNHPHYENNDLRARTRMLYTYLYGFKDIKLLHELLKNKYKIDYLVFESYYCTSHQPNKPECGMSQIAHLNDTINEKKTHYQACYLLISNSAIIKAYFKKTFEFGHISVYKVL